MADVDAKTPVMVVLHGVNNDEIELGPYRQVSFEVDVIGGQAAPTIKDVVTREVIVAHAGFWWHEKKAYKHVFVRAQQTEDFYR